MGDDPERTPDGRYLIIGGRRWRASDPAIPEKLRAELVNELMAARRAVRGKEAGARDRVQDAKVALGERGEPWWDAVSVEGRRQRLAAAIRALLRHRRPEATICPSDAARAAGGEHWRALVDPARAVAAELAGQGLVVITQGGKQVDVRTAHGPVRIARGPAWPS